MLCVSFSLEQCLQFKSHKRAHKWKRHGIAVMSYPSVVMSCSRWTACSLTLSAGGTDDLTLEGSSVTMFCDCSLSFVRISYQIVESSCFPCLIKVFTLVFGYYQPSCSYHEAIRNISLFQDPKLSLTNMAKFSVSKGMWRINSCRQIFTIKSLNYTLIPDSENL